MRNEFCTLFDLNFLPRGLVLYRSLAELCPDLRLRVFCMDEASKSLLDRMALPGLFTVGLDELEAHDRDLARVKPTRSAVEYCWTATPAVCLYTLEREPRLEQITYLDADLMFFEDPAPLFDEMGDASILIVPHRFAEQHEHLSAISGVYNVQFMTFRRTDEGLTALRWWRERCLEWCYARSENGKFGDQKYLDDWPERFRAVHVLEHPGGGLAPWNVGDFILARRDGSISVDGRPLVFFHYHALLLYRGVTALRRLGALADFYRFTPGRTPLAWADRYPTPEPELSLIWHPYVRRLGEEIARIRELEPGFTAGFTDVGLGTVAYQVARELVPRPVRRRLRRALRLVK